MLECISVWRYCDPAGFHPMPSHPQIPDQDNARRAKPGEPFTFTGETFLTHILICPPPAQTVTFQWMPPRLDGGRWPLMWCMRISKWWFSSRALYSIAHHYLPLFWRMRGACLIVWIAGRSSEPFTSRRSGTGSMRSPSPPRREANTGSLSISTGWR